MTLVPPGTMMHWLPAAADFRGELRAALETARIEDRVEKLARLAEHQLGFVETIQLARAIEQLGQYGELPLSRIRLAILSSSTVDHLIPGLRVAGLRRRLLIDVHVGPYGQYRQQLLDDASSLRAFRPEFVLLSISAREAIAQTPLAATSADVETALDGVIGELSLLWNKARKNFNATVIQQTFLNVAEPLFGSYDRLVPGAPAQQIAASMIAWRPAAREGALLLDIARASERDGIDAWFDAARWLQGKIEIAPQAARLYGELVVRIIAAQRGLSKKCLVLDLDNTLWGGVVGDDGLEGIVLARAAAPAKRIWRCSATPSSSASAASFWRSARRTTRRSRRPCFAIIRRWSCKRSDIAAFVANWDDKAANLKGIAAQLNIGLDSLVFVDDNPRNVRASARACRWWRSPSCPRMRPLRALPRRRGIFRGRQRSRPRTDSGANSMRRMRRASALRRPSQSLDDFLHGLEMSVVFGPFQSVDLPRDCAADQQDQSVQSDDPALLAPRTSLAIAAGERLHHAAVSARSTDSATTASSAS